MVENGSGAKLNGHLSAFAENLFESDCNNIFIEISERIQIALSFCGQIICKVKMNCNSATFPLKSCPLLLSYALVYGTGASEFSKEI